MTRPSTDQPQRTVLLIAFQFPPMTGSSAIQRTLRFAQHLPRFGWHPIVLTATTGAYERTDAGSEKEIQGLDVHRARALDAARHLSFFGRYPGRFAIPDRWMSWRYWAVSKALRLVREKHVDVVWTTFPIATAHQIGLTVSQRCAVPWVAEFRDPMWQGDYPPDPRVNQAWKTLEQRIFARADKVVVTTPGAAAEYRGRYPDYGDSRIQVVENGFDEETFSRAESRLAAATTPIRTERLTLLHSGVIYPSERDPTQLFDALAHLKSTGDAAAGRVQLTLRATGNDALFRRMIAERNIEDMVRLEPAIGYLAALEEMLQADGLLILQAANCNAQVPAKLYEYLRAGRPIVGLTDPLGDTAATLRAAGVGMMARLDSRDEIAAVLREFVLASDAGQIKTLRRQEAGRYSREHRTAEIAGMFDSLLENQN